MFKRLITISIAIMIAIYPLMTIQAATGVNGEEPPAPPPPVALSAEQIDNLLAPIALYPDPLLAQILPASTFVDQVDAAARYLRGNNSLTAGVDDQPWDVSVKSIAHYPTVVYQMSMKLDWTTALGQSYVSQSTDVFKSIQRLRDRAKKAGYLVSNPQQTIIIEKEIIKIVPAQASVIFVPTYNPQVVYVPVATGPSTSTVVAATAIAFGAGLAIGAWLNNDCNWYSHTVYYHGWHGTGWVSHSATVIRTNNGVYVNHRYSTGAVHVNSAVVHRNVNYANVNHYSSVNRNVNYNNVNVNSVNRNSLNVNNVNHNNISTNQVNRNNINNNNLSRNINTNNAYNNAYRGKATTGAHPAHTNTNYASGFGGGGTAAQTRAQSSRGQASRASAHTSRTRPSRGGGGRRR
jgi:hypothetical protein